MFTRGKKASKDGTIQRYAAPAELTIPVPSHLKGLARQEFTRVVGVLFEQGRLHKVDPRLIEQYAEMYKISVDAYRCIQKESIVYVNDAGKILPNPAFSILKVTGIRMAAMSARLGLHNHDGVGLDANAMENPEGDEWGGLLSPEDDLEDLSESA